ncbi:MAG: DUF3726 domain-containing protein [Hyphomicrobiales bacterium]
MKTSYDEIRRMCFRALDAAGAAAGIDEDSAHAVAWLEAVGMPGLNGLADALDGGDPSERSRGLAVDTTAPPALKVSAGGRSCVFFAPSLIDLLVGMASKNRDGPVTLRLEKPAHPLFLIPAAVRFCPSEARISLRWKSDDDTTEVETTRNMVIRLEPDTGSRQWQHALPVGTVELTYVPADDATRADRRANGSSFVLDKSAVGDRLAAALRDGLDVDDRAYDRIAVYAAQILVPETEASRISGAGAGLTDND